MILEDVIQELNTKLRDNSSLVYSLTDRDITDYERGKIRGQLDVLAMLETMNKSSEDIEVEEIKRTRTQDRVTR